MWCWYFILSACMLLISNFQFSSPAAPFHCSLGEIWMDLTIKRIAFPQMISGADNVPWSGGNELAGVNFEKQRHYTHLSLKK